jgi:hypothetical protein
LPVSDARRALVDFVALPIRQTLYATNLTLLAMRVALPQTARKQLPLILSEADKWLTKWLLKEVRGTGKNANMSGLTHR